ncbi:hypothetical protein E9228_002360 [Curtobacterium flaccumfaciens]|uniref:Uncharacterized protein n=1 Tax=Curtobacterium salicis TaxID=1779862 RepID=A0ABX0TBZ5_9MICO|nr:hypothetical protein [Curtobacterium sp. WW7]NII41713.1 hypothetical protein [Curtobacterium sp. WW7]
MARSLTDELGEYAAVLDDSRVAQFLASKNWTIQSNLGYAQVWSEPGAEGQQVAHVLLPRNSQLEDYTLRLQQAISRISDTYDWRVSDLAEQIAAVRADLFFVRIDQHMADGTIPLRQATGLLDSIDDMIRSAAITADNPFASGRGRTSATVNDFLNDDVRMGHTKHGSFIITVAARLDDVGAEVEALQKSGEQSENNSLPVSFTRQVMTTLARSLNVTKQIAESAPDAPALDDAISAGMRLPMVKALRSMGNNEGLRSIDLSFEWAPIEPQRENLDSEIKLSRETVLLLDKVEDRLVREEPPREVTLTGPVVELRRGERVGGDDAERGEIVVRADVDGSWKRVTVELSGADYDDAIAAHRQQLPFVVSGVLEKVKRSWALTSRVKVDRSFLEFKQQRDDSAG